MCQIVKWITLNSPSNFYLFIDKWEQNNAKNTTHRPKLCRNYAFPQNFHTSKLGEIKVFFVVEGKNCGGRFHSCFKTEEINRLKVGIVIFIFFLFSFSICCWSWSCVYQANYSTFVVIAYMKFIFGIFNLKRKNNAFHLFTIANKS